MDGVRKKKKKKNSERKKRNCVTGSSCPWLCPKFGLQTLHCIITEESGRDSRRLLDRHFREWRKQQMIGPQ